MRWPLRRSRVTFRVVRHAALLRILANSGRLLLTCSLCTFAHPLLAQQAPNQTVSGSGDAATDSPLSPAPAQSLRSFSTDRPTKSNVPYTVDAGHWQYETDLASWSQLAQGDLLTGPNLTLKLGITRATDVELNILPYERIHTRDHASGATTTAAGFGDLVARLKLNIWGNDGGGSALALIPYVKVPTARSGIGNGAVEGGVIVPLSVSLAGGLTLLLNSGVAINSNAPASGHHASFTNLVNLSHALGPKVTVYAELWSDAGTGAATQVSADAAVAWSPAPNLQLDAGINVGLNQDTSRYDVYLGAAQRF
jgi:hypothetical protein